MIYGRITKGVAGLYFVATQQGVFECSVRGIFRKNKITPIVGDYVFLEQDSIDNNKGAIIKIDERKNELIRPKVANIDQCVIVFSATKPSINYDLLDKFIILSEERNIKILICINKMDLIEDGSIYQIEKVYRSIGYKVVYCNIFDDFSVAELKNNLINKVSVFAGCSGVGKSSLVNKLIPSAKMDTNDLSLKIDRGKHTTRHAELLKLNKTSFILDTPGFSSIDLFTIDSNKLKYLFKEFKDFNHKCRYSDCSHISEPNCEVKNQIGLCIDEERYNRYKNIFLELKNKKN